MCSTYLNFYWFVLERSTVDFIIRTNAHLHADAPCAALACSLLLSELRARENVKNVSCAIKLIKQESLFYFAGDIDLFCVFLHYTCRMPKSSSQLAQYAVSGVPEPSAKAHHGLRSLRNAEACHIFYSTLWRYCFFHSSGSFRKAEPSIQRLVSVAETARSHGQRSYNTAIIFTSYVHTYGYSLEFNRTKSDVVSAR